MTMVSFRVDAETAESIRRWADRLGIDRSELLRNALDRYLARLASEREAERWVDLDEEETSLQQVAEWGVAEDWADWADATG